MLWFSNVIPEAAKKAGPAFKRRPVIHAVELVFKDDVEYAAYPAGQRPPYIRLADGTVKERMALFVDELDLVVRLLTPGLYMRKNVTRIRPMPRHFEEQNEILLKSVTQCVEEASGNSDDLSARVVAAVRAKTNRSDPGMSMATIITKLSSHLGVHDPTQIKKVLKEFGLQPKPGTVEGKNVTCYKKDGTYYIFDASK